MTNRESLLEAALVALQEKGYAETTARDVARGAGVSLGAIGYHYGSTQDLLDAALAEGVRRWFEPLIGLLAQPLAPSLTLAQLAPMLDGLADTLNGHRPLVIGYFEALLRAERSPALRTSLATDFHALRTALTGALADLLSRQPAAGVPDPQTAASLLMATIDGLIIQWLLDPTKLPTGQLIVDTLHRAAALVAIDPPPTGKAAVRKPSRRPAARPRA